MKQMLIYQNVKPVNRQEHGDLALKSTNRYDFARETNAVPLVVGEFQWASEDYPVVFTPTPEGLIPSAILGVRDKENAFVKADGSWDARYIPAFVRRYPFVFGGDPKGETFTLMIDDSYEGLNRENKGERLFDGDGTQTQFLNQTLNFLREYQAQFLRTRTFCERLKELDLLAPVEAHVPLPEDPKRTLSGFQVVNREKLKALSDKVVDELFRRDELEAIYLHQFSLRNIGRVHERIIKVAPAA